MEDLYHYKYLSIKAEELDNQLKDSLARFKVDFKDYIVNDEKQEKEDNNNGETGNDDNDSYSSDNSNKSFTDDEQNIPGEEDNDEYNIDDGDNDNDNDNKDDDELENDDIKKNKDSDCDTAIERKKKKKRRRRKQKKELSEKDKLILRLYRKLSKILHPDKNPSCHSLFLKLKKYYDDKNLIEMVIIADLFDVSIDSEEIDSESYKKDIEELDKKMNNINNNFIWMLYYGTQQQRQLVRQRLMEKLK